MSNILSKISHKKITDKYKHFVKNISSRLNKNEKTIIKGTGVGFFLIFLTNISSFIILFMKTKLMTASDVGLFVLAKSIVVTMFMFTNGFYNSIFRYNTVFLGEGSNEKIKGVISVTYKYIIPFLIGTALISILSAPYVAVNIFHNTRLAGFVQIIVISALFSCISDINSGILRSKLLPQYTYLFKVLEQFLIIPFVFILYKMGMKNFLLMFSLSFVFSSFLVFIYSLIRVRKEFSFIFDSSLKSIEHPKKIFAYSFFSQITGLMLKFRTQVNVFLMGFFLSTKDIALYNVAFQLGMATTILMDGLNTIFPTVSGVLYGQNKIDEIKRLHRKTAKILVIISIFIFLGFIVAGKFVLGIFGDVYKSAYIPLLIIAFSFVLEANTGSAGRIIDMMGKPQYNSFNNLVALILTVGFCYLCIPRFGIIGSAVAFSLSNIVKRYLMLWQLLFLFNSDKKNRSKQKMSFDNDMVVP
ncbi:Polysaccharide biosynthesis protein [Candidatus Omnitrophus magneticus]|uniref:Polysaccharide biosynthesis protein n=1 Tax=Candidatus Omnitrophus magneticus TaxID=1609969 RepID=A0A0F0CW52_9BACT|nr:Polysaccharide biosynthesis protein [Candidatus Omnitrophus magneticus]